MALNRQLILDRYRPIAEAGVGGFGTVQVAWDVRIQRKVAIKCIQISETDAVRAAFPKDPAESSSAAEGGRDSYNLIGDTPQARSLTHVPGLDEARTAALLTDANIVTVYDFEVQDLTAYLIMEYVEGVTLTKLLRECSDRLTIDTVAAVFAAISHALEVAHDNQVLHLDIKPDNVLINRQGQVKVTDFGLAMLADASGFGTAGGGTIGYMPLEQMRQESLDVRCDEWALASIVYEMLSGENPFLAPDLDRAEAAIEDAELVLPSLCWDDLDSAVDDVIFRALDPEREERYRSVSNFAEELEPLLGDPKRGTRELAAIVGYANDEEENDEPPCRPVAPRVPLRDRITPTKLKVVAHVMGGLGSGAVAYIALASVPQTSGFSNPLFWGMLALLVFAGALKPHLGALLSYLVLSIALVVQDAPAWGCILIVATAVWWYFAGRAGDAEANIALAPPLAGALGCNQLTPLVAGFCLPPLRALGTVAFAALVSVFLGALGSHSLLGWDVLAFWNGGMPHDIQASLGGMMLQPAPWCVIASWIAAAAAVSVLRLRPTRVFAAFGVFTAAALLLVGISVAAWFASGQTTWMPSMNNLVFTLVPSVIMLIACVLLPTYVYEDEDEAL